MFKVTGIRSGYSEVTVIKGIDLDVEQEIFAVLGANGAGKTTLLATMARLIPLMAGEMWFDETDISDLHPWQTAALGLAYATQFHAWIHADARIQERLESATRATATSVRELLSNLVSMGVLAGVGALSVAEDPTRGLLMMLAGVALVAVALAVWVPDRATTTDARGVSATRSERDAATDG